MSRDMVLLHGGLYDSSCWDKVIASLEADDAKPFGRFLCLDLPGSGRKRGSLDITRSREEILDGLNAEVGKAALRDPVLLGHSIAASLVIEMATARPYSALCVLTGPVLEAGDVPGELFGSGVHGAEADKVGFPADPGSTSELEMHRLRFCLDMSEAEADAWLEGCRQNAVPPSIMQTPVRAIDSRALPPATYIIAERSPVFPVEWQERFGRRLGGDVRIERISTGHAPFLTDPVLLAKLLTKLYGEDG